MAMKKQHPIVGVWRVTTQDAPFNYHMFVFHAGESEGIFQQFNPHEGNRETSDTPGSGLWRAQQDGSVRAMFGEFRLDRNDATTTYAEVSFEFTLNGGSLSGLYRLRVYTPDSKKLLRGPIESTLEGTRLELR